MMIHPTTLPTMHEGVGFATAVENKAVTLVPTTMFEDTGLDVLPVVDSVHTYKRDIAPYERYSSLTPEQRAAYTQALVAQVRAGDAEAREQLITYVLSGVVRQAERYFFTYGWQHPMMELSDLIQAGNLALLEHLDVALSKHDPCTYLLTYTHAAIRRMRFTDTLMPTPWTRSPLPRVFSLDQPLSLHDERPLIEVLASPSECPGDDGRDFTPLYQAIDQLTEGQRRVILRHYGLCDTPVQEPREIDQALYQGKRLSYGAERRALATLAGLLSSTYLGQGEHQIVLSPSRGPRDCEHTWLKDEEVARLDAACAALQARGEPITHTALKKEAHIAGECVSAYRSQRGLKQTSSDRLERLRQAHATMAAQGASMNILELSRLAHVEYTQAHRYLRQLGITSDYHAQRSEEAQRARLDQAYATLAARHPRVGVEALMDTAHVSHSVAAPYLEERRAAEGLPPRITHRRLPPRAHHDERQQLLAEVYEEMLQHGVPITLDRLCKASGLRIDEARAFLAKRGMTWEQRQERERTERLETAYTSWLEQKGQPPTIRQLTKAAQVTTTYARRFLAERGMTRQKREAQERTARLEAAYTSWLEQQPQPPTVEQLTKAAQTTPPHARRFLAERHMTWQELQERARIARLETAYSCLVAQGQPVGVTLLSKAAHVSTNHASRFLSEQQSQAKGTAR